MWQRVLNWVAIGLVGTFGILWSGVVVFAAVATPVWIRAAEGVFGVFLVWWAGSRAVRLLLARRTAGSEGTVSA